MGDARRRKQLLERHRETCLLCASSPCDDAWRLLPKPPEPPFAPRPISPRTATLLLAMSMLRERTRR